MSEYVVKLPDVGEGIAEAEIVEWHVAAGDTITEDQVMVEVMTDKATVELPSPVAGVVTSLGGGIGDVLAVGSPLIRIDTSTDAKSDSSSNGASGAATDNPPSELPQPAEEGLPEPMGDGLVEPATNGHAHSTGVSAAPAVRQRAAALGIDLATVTGTGPDGRVVHDDLDTVLRAQANTPAAERPAPKRAAPVVGPADDTVDEVKVIGLRRNIAQRMDLAKTRIPHFTYVEEIDVTELERLRSHLNQERLEGESRLTLLPFLMRATVVSVVDFPQMNARYDDDNGIVNRHRAVHLGVATQTSKGLMVPVVHHAEALDLWSFADEIARLSVAARNGSITIEELTGSTITISSLGALGGIAATPIINYPEVAIIGVNKVTTRPVYLDGTLYPRQIMNLSSSFDHRVVDGADAAAFIQRVKALLETPALLFMP
jgi:2-oxoisovalerate dehydrogenase E2 component (dihydrolipoyl transacylase)